MRTLRKSGGGGGRFYYDLKIKSNNNNEFIYSYFSEVINGGSYAKHSIITLERLGYRKAVSTESASLLKPVDTFRL